MDAVNENPELYPFIADIEENLYAFYRSFEKGGHAGFYLQDGLAMVKSRSSGWPGFILGNNAKPGSLPVLLKVAATGISKGVFPPFWILQATDGQEEAFKQAGFHLVNRWKGMGLMLDQSAGEESLPDGFTIRTVSDSYQAENWFSVVKTEVLGNYDLSLEQFSALVSDDVFRLYVGYHGEAPMCTALLFLTGEVAGLYFVATNRVFRNRGYGTAITFHAIREAQRLGYRRMVLHATRKAEKIYASLGFESFCYLNIFWFPPVH